jgi:hypothetical protein
MRRAFNSTLARYIAFQFTEVSMLPRMFAEILLPIGRLRARPAPP